MSAMSIGSGARRKAVNTFSSTVPPLEACDGVHLIFADNWKTARVVRDLGSNNPDEPEPPTP